MWYLFAFAGTLFASVRRTSEKKLSHQLHPFTIGWTVQLMALPVLGIIWLSFGSIYDPFTLPLSFWLSVTAIVVGFYPLNTWLYVTALKHGELSEIMPLHGFGPIFALLIGWIVAGQRPSLFAAAGIMLIATGVYVMYLKGRRMHNPLASLQRRAARYTIAGLLLVALVGLLDQIAIKATDPYFFSFISTFGAAIILYAAARLRGVTDSLLVHGRQLGLAGSLFGLSYVCYSISLSTGPVAYVNAIRSSGILIGVMIGIVYLKERLTWQKATATVLIVAGSVLIIM